MKLREPWTCVFCNSFPVSDEHFWPEWCHHLFERGSHDSYRQYQEDSVPGRKPKLKHEKHRHGHIVTKTIHCVCHKCNNEWMSALETAAKPLILPLMAGQPCTLSADNRRTLASWIALKIMVSEHDLPKLAVTPDHDRLVFREALGIPRYYRIRIGFNASGWKVGFFRVSRTLSFADTPTPSAPAPVPPLGSLIKNVHSVAIIMGKLFIHATAARIDGFDLDNVIAHQDWGVKVFPDEIGEDIAWPPVRALDKRAVSILARSLDYLDRLPRFRWAGFLSDEQRKEWEPD